MSAALTERTVNTAALRPVLMKLRVTLPAEAFTAAVTSKSYGNARAGRTPRSCFGMPKVICEVEDGVQITAPRAGPGRDVRVMHPEALLDELDDRGVIRQFRVHVAPLAPGRDCQERYTEAHTYRQRGETRP